MEASCLEELDSDILWFQNYREAQSNHRSDILKQTVLRYIYITHASFTPFTRTKVRLFFTLYMESRYTYLLLKEKNHEENDMRP